MSPFQLSEIVLAASLTFLGAIIVTPRPKPEPPPDVITDAPPCVSTTEHACPVVNNDDGQKSQAQKIQQVEKLLEHVEQQTVRIEKKLEALEMSDGRDR